MREKRNDIVNDVFLEILSLCTNVGGNIVDANRFDSGWISVTCKHNETGLGFRIQFDIDQVIEK